MDCTIQVAKTKALISFAVTAKLICVFVFAYAKIRFSHDAAYISLVMRKHVFRVPNQVRHKPPCSAAENSYRLKLIETRGVILSRQRKNGGMQYLTVLTVKWKAQDVPQQNEASRLRGNLFEQQVQNYKYLIADQSALPSRYMMRSFQLYFTFISQNVQLIVNMECNKVLQRNYVQLQIYNFL